MLFWNSVQLSLTPLAESFAIRQIHPQTYGCFKTPGLDDGGPIGPL